MNNEKIIVVTGATGKQGGAVVKHLLKLGFSIKAVSRRLNSEAASVLRQQGADVVFADLDKPETLQPIFEGAYGVYSVQNNWTSNIETEIKQGKAVADVAKKVGVQHLVYSSVGGAERNTGVPHFDSKHEIEKYIISLKIPYTFIRPVYFVENLVEQGSMAFINWSLLSWALKGGKKLQLVDVDDIGAFVALAFSQPEHYKNKAIELAGDEKNFEEIKKSFRNAGGTIPKYLSIPAWLIAPMNKEAASMFTWFKHAGYQSDLNAIHSVLPEVKNLDQALIRIFKK